jgi:predicted  nucleic acid-binding Zn-ribbon protein
LQQERDRDFVDKDREKEHAKKAKKAVSEAREDLTDLERKHREAKSKVAELELDVSRLSSTNEALQQDLKLAFKRISDLQQAFEAIEDSDVNLSDLSSGDEDDLS